MRFNQNPTAFIPGDGEFENRLYDKKLPTAAIPIALPAPIPPRKKSASSAKKASQPPISSASVPSSSSPRLLVRIGAALTGLGLRLQSWARRQRRLRAHLQLWTPAVLLIWTIVYTCMAWEYDDWKVARAAAAAIASGGSTSVGGVSLVEDIAVTGGCSCTSTAGGDGVMAYLETDRDTRFCLLPDAIASSTSTDSLGCSIPDDGDDYLRDYGFRHFLRALFEPSRADGPVEWKEFRMGKFLVRWGARFNPDAVTRGKVHQWLTYSFVHSSAGHFLFNALGLLLLGYFLEWKYGPMLVAVFTLLPAIVGGLFSSLVDPPCSALVGGSGIVYALLGLFIADQVQYLRTVDTHKRSFGLVVITLVFVVILVLVSVFANGSAAHSVHFVALFLSLGTAGPTLYERIQADDEYDYDGAREKAQTTREGLICAWAWIAAGVFSLVLIIAVYSLPDSRFECD